jgi:hypothetical protein
MSSCTTHHLACACREARSAKLEALAISARLWMEFVERNGGNYLPEHAQWIKTALEALDSEKPEG